MAAPTLMQLTGLASMQHQARKDEVDEALLKALYAPVIEFCKDDEVPAVTETPSDAHALRLSLDTVSLYHADRCPVLSSALHSLWDSMPARGGRKVFKRYRALIATAIIQYADGSPHTVSLDYALGSEEALGRYMRLADEAMEHLRFCGEPEDDD